MSFRKDRLFWIWYAGILVLVFFIGMGVSGIERDNLRKENDRKDRQILQDTSDEQRLQERIGILCNDRFPKPGACYNDPTQ